MVNAQSAQAQSTAALGALGGSLIGLAGSDVFSNAGGGSNNTSTTPTYTSNDLSNIFAVTNTDFTYSPSRTGI